MDQKTKLLHKRSTEMCFIEAINHLQELALAGKITRDQTNTILDILDFKIFVDKIETIRDQYVDGYKTKNLGDYLANEFTVVYAIKDAIKDWKDAHLTPIIEFVLKDQ